MKVNEIISESATTDIQPDHENVHNGAYIARDVGGYDRVYHMNRLMMAMAMADGRSTDKVDSHPDTWFEKYNTLHPYTEAEHNMVKAAMKTIPTDGHEIIKDHRSIEPNDVNKSSPYPARKKNKYGV
jgi:hypothetical protein